VRFLVEIRVKLPFELLDPEGARRRELLAAELERGVELRRNGTIEHIWRVPGQLRNVGIWQAADATELHEAICSLPLAPWLRVKVTPLADHPIELTFAQRRGPR
jgi:muconolactone D-isomerase